jgi:hypothetical protein
VRFVRCHLITCSGCATLQLNIYTARLASTKPGSTILGYAYSPWDVASNAVHDGVFVNDRTLPGGTATSGAVVYNKGVVTVHEVC